MAIIWANEDEMRATGKELFDGLTPCPRYHAATETCPECFNTGYVAREEE